MEGIVAKRLADAYHVKLARWHKVLNRGYLQVAGAPNGFASAAGLPAATEAAEIPERSLIAAVGVRTQRGQWWLPG